VEGKVSLKINGVELTCFAFSSLSSQHVVNAFYDVELTPFNINDLRFYEVSDVIQPAITQVEDSFVYKIIGTLNGNQLVSDRITFEYDFFLSDFGYLDGKKVAWEIDRIDAEFLT
jgi:hypothetical protein